MSMPMGSPESTTAVTGPTLSRFNLTASHLASLPPEVRDQVMDYLQAWGTPAEQLAVVQILRDTHGPLLFLLDYHALAALAQGNADLALEIIERRQRRGATIASQAIEARALRAAGHADHALAVADDISQANPRHSLVVRTAAAIYTAEGRFEQAEALMNAYLLHRPHDLTVELAFAQLAWQAGQTALAKDHIERLGAGIPADLDDQELQQLADLHAALENEQSALAVRLELERRRQQQTEQLTAALAPYVAQDGGQVYDLEELYRKLNGPDAIALTRDERRNIQLEAARHFGFTRLREGQTETIAAILREESILAVMPTGAGKSLCYQLPALILPKPTLVISPLIALMKDQVESLPAAARRQATFINSTLTDAELAARLEGVARGDYKLIYAAPERLRQLPFLRALRNAGLALFVVDEAHCVSLWGHDFRPDYLFIQEARHELGDPPALAMTATAPPRVRDEIIDYISGTSGPSQQPSAEGSPEQAIHPQRPRVMALDIFRNNLHLSALHFHNEEEKLTALLQFVTTTEGSGIVYVNSRHKAESLAFALREAGVAAEAYHAGIESRGAVQDRFMSDKTRIVVATIAFGMGIDKSDIRFIVHFHPSRSLAAYYQEVGRAGRDGKPSQGVLFYSNNDWANLRRWAKADEYNADLLERVLAAVATQLGIHPSEDQPAAQTTSISGPVDLRRLQQVLAIDETTLRVAVSMLERCELLARGFDVPQELVITLPRRLPAAAKLDPEFERLLRGLALGPGQDASFKTSDIANFMGWELDATEPNLLDWEAQGFLQLKSSRRAMLVELMPQPEDMRERIERMLSQSAAVAQRRIDDVVGYATTEDCRHGYISAHFGSPPRTHCDVCDNCTGILPDLPHGTESLHTLPDDADVEPMIIDCLMSLPRPVGRGGLARILTGSLRAPVTPDKARHHGRLKAMGESAIMGIVDDLIADNRLRQYERQGYPVLAPTLRGRTEAEVWLAEHPELAQMGEAPPIEEGSADEPGEEAAGDKYTALQKAIWLWRRRSAEEQGQPPYMIMSNELILRIAESRPQTLDELAQLPGMGAQRLEHYGPTLLDLIHLNPAQPGDADLITMQRNEPRPSSSSYASAAPAVSPQVERRIYLKLQEVRQKIAVADRSKPYQVANNTLLKTIAQQAPTEEAALEQIPGFRTSGLVAQTTQIVTFIREFRNGT
ncbi:MAG: HRDC domain-containing protein [Caldilineaceae bacterium]|nr:HRDC domain-containing protein [Caldilineaceae bacterium]